MLDWRSLKKKGVTGSDLNSENFILTVVGRLYATCFIQVKTPLIVISTLVFEMLKFERKKKNEAAQF